MERAYDHLGFLRGVRAFLDGLPIASLHAMREGLREVGCVDGTVGIFETLMDSKSHFLTANTDTVYAVTWLDLFHCALEHLRQLAHLARFSRQRQPKSCGGKPEEGCSGLSLCQTQSAGEAALREPLGQELQHHSRQRCELL